MFRRLACALLLVLFAPALALADPSWGDAFAYRQPDGEQVTVRIWGDEFYRVVESLDGYTLTLDGTSGEICYARLSADGRELESTGLRLGAAKDHLGLPLHLRIDATSRDDKVKLAREEDRRDMLAQIEALGEDPSALKVSASTLGDVRGLTILIDWADEVGTIQPSVVDDYCNQVGYAGFLNNGSIHDYFADVSNDLLNYTNYVMTYYYRAPYPKSYYDNCNTTSKTNLRTLMWEVLHQLDADGLDFSQFDANGDGYIDAINVYHAGMSDCPWSYGLWPHSGYWTDFYADGVRSYRYQCTGMGTSLRLGTFVHENGHMIGFWPDLYDYDGDSRGVGTFSIMCAYTSQTNPEHPDAWLKNQAGWETVIPLNGYQPGLAIAAGTNVAYSYGNTYGDHFLIENRQRTGRDAYLPDDGLAIWHCDPNGSNNYQDMTYARHYKVSLEQADGLFELEHDLPSDGDDLFGAPNAVEFSPFTLPDSDWWTGSSSGLRITDISVSGPTMTFTASTAAVYDIPADFATIQPALTAATDGSIITLADGVYAGAGNVDLDFGGKAITILSGSGDPTACVIDCGGAARAFTAGTDADIVVRGVTIRGGYVSGDGGAAQLAGSLSTFSDVVFEDCAATGDGGALMLAAGSDVLIERCVFRGNTAARGGAVACDASSPVIASTTFWANDAALGGTLYLGGGAAPAATLSILAGSATGAAVEGGAPVLDCCDVWGNAGGDFVGPLAGFDGVNGNFSADPFFCDAAAGDLTTRENSPCAAGWHPAGGTPCGEVDIGALGVGCVPDIFDAVTTGPTAIGGASRAAAVGDVDGDGDLDLFVANEGAADVLLLNDGAGGFADGTVAPLGDAGAGTGAAFADYDNDGDLDLYVTRRNQSNILYRNEGPAGWVDATAFAMVQSGPGVDATWIDFDGNGLVDLYVVNDGAANAAIDNIGPAGSFWIFLDHADAALADAGNGRQASWGDYDGDGDLDLYIANHGGNKLLQNNGAAGFWNVTGTGALGSTAFSGTGDFGDRDNDTYLDLYIANDGQPDVVLDNDYGTYSLVVGTSLQDAGSARAARWGDFDRDGYLDLYLARHDEEDRLLWNRGHGTFSLLGVPEGAGASVDAVWFDADGDGDLDVYVVKDGVNTLLINKFATVHHSLQVDLEGVASNRAALGAQLLLTAGFERQVRTVGTDLRQFFGLGADTVVDSLVVDWPSGERDVVYGIAVDQVLKVVEGQVTAVEDVPAPRTALGRAVPNPFNPSTRLAYTLARDARVELTVFDSRGRVVRTLRDGMETAGAHEAVWNGRDDAGRSVASGTYFARMTVDGAVFTARMALVK